MIQDDLGATFAALANIENPVENCRRAIEHYGETLKVHILESSREQYARTQINMGKAWTTLARAADKKESCARAIGCYEKASKVFTKEEFPTEFQLVLSHLKKTLEPMKETM